MIKLRQRTYITFFMAGFILGVIIGSLGVTYLAGNKIEKLYKSNLYLEGIIEDKNVKLQNLEDAVNNNQYILKDIEIILLYLDDGLEKVTVEKAIKEKYNNLIGKNVDDIDINLVTEVIDKRIFQTDMKQYKLKVEKVTLSERLRIWVKIEEIV